MRMELKRWSPLIVWVLLIFTIPNILSYTGDGPDLPKRFDKVIHFIEYMVLAILFYRGLNYPVRREGVLPFVLVVSAALAVGALDEFTQHFFPNRNSSILDWLADAAGGIVGTSLACMLLRNAGDKREIE